MTLKSTIQTLIFLLMSAVTIAQDCKEDEKFWFWPKDAGYCRVFGEVSPGKIPVLFISDVGMEYSYLKKNSKLKNGILNSVFFDQPGVTHSVCHDSSAKRLSKVTRYINTIQDTIFEMASINLVCHAQGCHFALAYAQKYPSRVKSLHMVLPPIIKKSEQFYLRKSSRLLPYMKDLNKAYGAMFFPETHQTFIESFPSEQKVNNANIFLYLSPEKINNLGENKVDRAYKLEAGQNNLSFLTNKDFWNAIKNNLLNSD